MLFQKSQYFLSNLKIWKFFYFKNSEYNKLYISILYLYFLVFLFYEFNGIALIYIPLSFSEIGWGKSPFHDIVLNKPGISQRKNRFTASMKGAV